MGQRELNIIKKEGSVALKEANIKLRELEANFRSMDLEDYFRQRSVLINHIEVIKQRYHLVRYKQKRKRQDE